MASKWEQESPKL